MIIGVLKEPSPETRVSLLPEHLATLKKWNVNVMVESGAGNDAYAPDEKYLEAGAQVQTRKDILQKAAVLLSINPFDPFEIGLPTGKIILGNYQPLYNIELIKGLAEKGLGVFSIDMIPRTTRAQSMDVLSSQANIAGYKAVLLAANLFPRYFPMFMTAAGSIPPAKVLILGA
ncbi:MAG: NAD(P)(+) transhydrogenase (Re/Si-specific) subunit alpha, partial [Ginsengibacter sp.]